MSGAQFAAICIGVVLLAVGGLSVAAWALRGRRNTAILLSFGAWCALYGLRLLALQPPVRATLGGSPLAWNYFLVFATYAINVPGMLFFVAVLGTGWRGTLRWVVAVEIAYAVVAALVDLALGRPGAARGPNNAIVLGGVAIGLANFVYRYRRGARETLLTEPIVMIGGALLLLFVANENLGRPVVPRLNLEPVGILVFVLCLGYAVVRAIVRNEAEFVSVQRELETARRIQSSLLPRRLPRVPGLDIAARYVPMTAVAGDIYDVIQVNRGAIGVLVADVSGHGVPAAIVASMVKLAFTAQADRADNPAAVLSAMNQILCRHLEHAYVTAVYAVIDIVHRTMTIANAGHPPLLIHRLAEPAPIAVDEHGLMLGFFPDAQYTSTRVNGLAPGDRVLLYTDGILEARDPSGEFFDSERTKGWLPTIERSTADGFAEAALADLTRWSGTGRFEDDVTFVVVEAVG